MCPSINIEASRAGGIARTYHDNVSCGGHFHDTKTGERWVNGARSGPEDRARAAMNGEPAPCLVPTRRILLAIQASEAMHADG